MAVAAIGAGLVATGAAVSAYGSYGQYKASRKAERLRARQVDLQSKRAQREQLRRAQVARAQAVARAYNQGAGESSALQGGLAQVTSQATRNIQSIRQDTEVSKGIFNANADYAKAGFIASTGEGISQVGSALISISNQQG